jgi:hypothetical protein
MSNWFDELKDGVVDIGMRMFRHCIVYRENGVMVPASAAVILGILAVGSYGTSRTDILKTLTNNKVIELMLEDEAEFASRLCS